MTTLADQLWGRFGAMSIDDVPREVATVAAHSILDWFGCALAGSREPLSEILRSEFGAKEGQCTLVGSTQRADLLRAGLINGAAGHALDFDDSSPVMGGHPSAALVPALVSLCESKGRTGAELLAAYVVGSEIQARIGAAIGSEHYGKGWHVTSTIGVFGATAGCCWLLDLDADSFGAAFGLAASGAAGLKANFGTMAKPLHPGSAAERGLLAARLAARGFTASANAVEGNQGLAQAAGNGSMEQSQLKRWEDDWATPRNLFKFHAACHFTHAGIEATGSIISSGVRPEDIERITLTVNPSIIDACGIPEPKTGLEAKFSLRGTQAMLVCGIDTAAPSSFVDDVITRDDVQRFLYKVAVETDKSLPAMASRVAVETADGEYRAAHDVSRPCTDLGEQGAKLRRKYDVLADPVLGSRKSRELGDQLADLAGVGDIRSLLALAR